MDPNATLGEIRRILARAHSPSPSGDDPRGLPYVRDLERLAELVVALDDWISRGGFLPLAWDPSVSFEVEGPIR